MRVSFKTLGSILGPLAPTRAKQEFFHRVLEVRPECLSLLMGSWYDQIGPWKKNVDDFDRRLLGLLGQRKIGLHFSLANWQMPVEQDPSLDALRAGESGKLHYWAINPGAGFPRALNPFPNWVNLARNYLIVIGREQESVKKMEGEQAYYAQIVIKAPPFSVIYQRSEWLVKEPIPLLNLLDFFQASKLETFAHLSLLYQSKWQYEFKGGEPFHFYLMLFAVVNGLSLLDALKYHWA